MFDGCFMLPPLSPGLSPALSLRRFARLRCYRLVSAAVQIITLTQ